MSIGFRKSLVGFNCEDVINYIEASHKTHAENEEKLKNEISELNNNIENLTNTISTLTAERDKIASRLHEFDEKYEEIDRIAENIGKLYLVAQSNAHAIMKNSSESSSLATEEIQKNIAAIAETQDALTVIRSEMADVNKTFSSKLEELMDSLSDTKDKITKKTYDSKQRDEDFAAVMQMLEQ